MKSDVFTWMFGFIMTFDIMFLENGYSFFTYETNKLLVNFNEEIKVSPFCLKYS